ncbi:MAG: radical SAM protein [Niabella sp.]
MKLDLEAHSLIKECKKDRLNIGNLDSDTLEFLKKQKIVVEILEDDDFVWELEFKTNQQTYSQSNLTLTIAPTTDCNFACPYCFEEDKKTQKMSAKVIDGLVHFINDHTNAKCLNITWYGGEPLMAFEEIKEILEKISAETSIQIKQHHMITNGFLINPAMINLFKKYPLNTIQITLDGNEERHNSLRFLKCTNKPSYKEILKNIEILLNELQETQIHLRINIDKNNFHEFPGIAEELKTKWKDKNLIVYPGILRIDNADKTNLACPALQRAEVAALFINLKQKGLCDVQLYPTHFDKVCSATNINSYVIGPLGEIYKCWNDVSDKSKIIGNICSDELTNKSLLYRYIVACKWHSDSKCRACFFLPICSGACAWYNLRNIYKNGKYDLCSIYKSPNVLKQVLEIMYEERFNENTNQQPCSRSMADLFD